MIQSGRISNQQSTSLPEWGVDARWQPPRLSNEVGGYIFLLEEVVELVLEAPLISSRLRAEIWDPISSSEDSSAPTPARGSLLGNAGVTSERLVMAEDELASPPASVPSSLDKLGLLTPQLKLSTLSPWIWKTKYIIIFTILHIGDSNPNPKKKKIFVSQNEWCHRSYFFHCGAVTVVTAGMTTATTTTEYFSHSICSQILLNRVSRNFTKSDLTKGMTLKKSQEVRNCDMSVSQKKNRQFKFSTSVSGAIYTKWIYQLEVWKKKSSKRNDIK